jgi:hypothetical protein
MKKASAPHAAEGFAKRSSVRITFIAAVFPLIAVIAAVCSGGVSARGLGSLGPAHTGGIDESISTNAVAPMDSSLVVQIGFNPVNQPPNFTAGVPNPASQPLRIQTQRADGSGENVTGPGQNVFIQITSSSPTGRFAINAAGPFTASSLTLTIGSLQQNTLGFFYLDPTPGTIVLTGTGNDSRQHRPHVR